MSHSYSRLERIIAHLPSSTPTPSSSVSSSPCSSSSSSLSFEDVLIIGVARTPIGCFNGSLASYSAPELASYAIRAALSRAKVPASAVEEVFFGNVLTAGVGQAPARQAALKAGLSSSVPCTTINKVCASGMKALQIGTQSIQCGARNVVVVGGMESMSNAPYLLPNTRRGETLRLGNGTLVDAIMSDGLTDAYNSCPMGVCAEMTATEMKITRKDNDDYAINSYKKAQEAAKRGDFGKEITPIPVKAKKGAPSSGKGPTTITSDEEIYRVDFNRLPTLPTVFPVLPPSQLKKASQPLPTPTVTAANASKINDGAAALILVSKKYAESNGLIEKIKSEGGDIYRVVGQADAATDPLKFTIAPSLAIPVAIKNAGLSYVDDIDYYEINEAFSTVSIANMKKLGLKEERVNIWGGAVAMGHPIGCSGARILITLTSILSSKKARYGCASICNGGGGASAVIIERL